MGCGWNLREVNTQVTSTQGTGWSRVGTEEEARRTGMLRTQGCRWEAAKDTWQEAPEASGWGKNHMGAASQKPKEENASRRKFC